MKKMTFLLLLICLVACRDNAVPERTGFEGAELPSFDLLLADSMTYLNTKDIPVGKPIVLLLFGPHCPYSRAQMDGIIKNMKFLRDVRFYIFTIWPFSDMKLFYEHYGLKSYSNVTVGIDYNNYFSSYFGVKGVPYLAIFGSDRRLISAFMGNVDGRQIWEVIRN